jgi:DNA-directed RNA polymerase specialized sigma24 family protein
LRPVFALLRRAANGAMARCAAGADAAFADVYVYLAPRLSRMLFRRTGDRRSTEELLERAALQMYLARGSFDPDGDVVHWAYGIVRELLVEPACEGRDRASD